MPATARVAGVPLAAVLVAVLVVGCGDDDPGPSPGPNTSASTESATDDPTASTSPEPTESTEPAVVPASGLLLEEETSQLNAPEGEWKRIPDVVTYATAVGSKTTVEVISLSDRENFATPTTLDEQVRFHRKALPPGAIVERQPDVLLDGEPAYYLQWYVEGDTLLQHDLGLDIDGRVIAVNLELERDDPETADAIVASVLASFSWR